MFRTLFERRRQAQRAITVGGQRHDVGHLRLATGQRAGLVEGENGNFFRALQRLGVFDQNSGARALPGADHDRRRRRQPERARTGNDQHGHGIDQRLGEIAGIQPPADESRQRNRTDDRHEHRRNPVGQALYRRLRALRLADQADDPGQQGLFADPGCPAMQDPLAIGGRREHLVAQRLAHRHALAGQHRFVHAGHPLDHLAIDRHALARADHEDIAGHQRIDGDLDPLAVTLDARRLRLQPDQRFDRFRGPGLGARLQQLAEQNHGDDRRPAFEIDMLIEPEQRHHRRKSPGHAGAERDQHIHVGAAAAQCLERAIVETPTDPELNRRRQRELQPARQLWMVMRAAEHEEHLADQRQGQRHRDPEAANLALVVGLAARLFARPRVFVNDAGRKAGLGHRRDHRRFIRRAIQPHPRPLGGQIDVGLDPRLAVEYLFQPRRTGRTGHAGNGKFDNATIASHCRHGSSGGFVHLTSITGHAARCSTRLATEPMTSPAMPLRPWVPMTIRSHDSSLASRAITSAAWPT